MKYNLYIIALCLLFSYKTSIAQDNKSQTRKFISYKEIFNTKEVCSFMYPDNFKITRIQNGICIHEKNLVSESDILANSTWNIWLYNAQEESIEQLMLSEQSSLHDFVKTTTDTITINDHKAIHAKFLNKNNVIIHEVIYLKQSNTLVELINKKNPSKDFEIFSYSFQLKL